MGPTPSAPRHARPADDGAAADLLPAAGVAAASPRRGPSARAHLDSRPGPSRSRTPSRNHLPP
eukprot:15451055-Alexandrium_andersonii.AAC.1